MVDGIRPAISSALLGVQRASADFSKNADLMQNSLNSHLNQAALAQFSADQLGSSVLLNPTASLEASMVNMMLAATAYKANLQTLSTLNSTSKSTLDLLV